jgi:putative transposase
VQTSDANHSYAIAEHYLNRNFDANWLAGKWVSDLTYIKTQEGWLYPTAVLSTFRKD